MTGLLKQLLHFDLDGRVRESLRSAARDAALAAVRTLLGSVDVYKRQPALDAGVITPASVIDDYPVEMLGGSIWPVNAYSGYRGMMKMCIRDSLQPSRRRLPAGCRHQLHHFYGCCL